MVQDASNGTDMAVPERQVIGFVDSDSQIDAILTALEMAGFESRVEVWTGEDGIHLLERMRETAFFGDWEKSFIQRSIVELKKGHSAIAVSVADRDEAVRVTDVVTAHDVHGCHYFGPLVNEQLTR